MESRFAHLRHRDTSVSMMRVRMSRRRSQTQKENRERTVNSRRNLDNLPELELSSMDSSIAVANVLVVPGKTENSAKAAKNVAADERLKQLQRWKERKALEKEKEKREKEQRGVFKTGVYHPKNHTVAAPLPLAPAASTRVRETRVTPAASQSTRVTRSMKQQVQTATLAKPLKAQDSNTVAKRAVPAVEQPTRSRAAPAKAAPAKSKGRVCPVEPMRALPTRLATRAMAPLQQDKLRDNLAAVRATRSKAGVKPMPPCSERKKACEETQQNDAQPAVLQEPELRKQPGNGPRPASPAARPEAEDNIQPVSDLAGDPAEGPSFAPQGFVFQAPSGLSSFKFEPLPPRSGDASLKPSVNFGFPPVPVSNVQHQEEPGQASPSKSPRRSLLRTPSTVAPQTPACLAESKHDVPYFRAEIANETERLTSLCGHWEAKVEDESIPEEMRDRMRTAVGQARLLMKERFNQFGGLVDDCEFARGEKVTTCTDLQGFWDMVYFQVEDVNKKFEALRDAESRGWAEERRPPPRQKKVVKKAATGPPSKPAGATAATAAAAKSRLAAAKAAMKAKQQAAKEDGAGGEETSCPDTQEPRSQGAPASSCSMQSPLKPPASLRRSSRLSAAVQPQPSPSSSGGGLSTRRVTRQPPASAHTPIRSASLLPTPEKTPSEAETSRPGNPPLPLSPEPSRSPPSLPAAEGVSACMTPAVVRQAPEPSACPSFTLSPCGTPPPPPTPSRPTTTAATAEAQGSTCPSAGNSAVEDMPGLDFERYLQPSLRCSLSPGEPVAMETLSPTVPDVEMESPRGPPAQPWQDTAVPLLSALPPPKAAEAALLLFTPDPKDRIRQSVCPSDLMVFTPPL